MLTQSDLKEKIHYNPETGNFTWRIKINGNTNVGSTAGSTSNSNKYRQIRINGVYYGAHRLAWLYVYGNYPKGQIDHINGVRLDNRIANLRDVSQFENQKNTCLRKNNRTGITGVSWHIKKLKWCANIQGDKKQISIGGFDDFFEACCARKSAEIKYGYHENHGRPKENPKDS